LSHFLLLLLHPRQIRNGRYTRTRASARNKNSCIMTDFWLRDNLYRDTAPVPATNFVPGDKFAAPINIVPRHSYSSQNLYPDGKKCAIPSLHRDNFSAKEPGPCPVLASGNTTSLYCRAVSTNTHRGK
jgi:hypothetical protein